MNVIWTCLCFYNFYALVFAQFPNDDSDIRFYLTIYDLPTVFWCEDYVILTIPLCMR